MKKSILWAAMAAMALTACNKEEIAAPAEGQNLVYREYTATIEDGASTKVSFGDPNTESGKIPAYFENGDKIALTDGTVVYEATVTKAEGQANTIGGNMPEDFTPTAAYYPYEAYNDGKLTVPTTQTYGSVPVLLQSSSIEDENITFSAADAGSAVICYTLTGDIAIKEAKLYTPTTANLINYKNADYELNFDEPLALSDIPEKIYFVVSASEAKSVTLEVLAEKPEDALGTADFSYYRRKTSVIEFTSGKVIEMPLLELTKESINDGAMVWKFGSENGGANSWTAGNNGILDATNPHYAAVTMGSTYTTTQKNGDNVVELDQPYYTFRSDFGIKTGFDVNIGTYRYCAIMSDVEYIVRDGNIAIPAESGAKVNVDDKNIAGRITFDTATFGQWHGKNSANGKTGAIKTDIANTNVWYYDMLGDFGNGTFLPTNEFTTFKANQAFQFKIADLKVTLKDKNKVDIEAPTYKIYWIGFFNNTSEIQAMIDQTEAAVAGENTPAE